MSVHPALLIEDILDEIFYYCDFIGHHGMLENATLASLALVCTTFHEPAIRVLWRELRALTPLFRLIPSCHLQDHDNHANDSQGEVVSYDENVSHSHSTSAPTDPAIIRTSRISRCTNGADCESTLATFGSSTLWTTRK